MDQSPDIRFDGWTLRRQPPELLRGDTRVRLQDQPLLVLEELLTHPGELVTRERLIARLWPKRVVDFDTALNATVRRLRAALGDEAETPRYIETVPRHGYRFIGTIAAPTAATDSAAVQEEVPPRPASRRWPYGVAVAALLVLMAVPLTWFAATRRDAPAAHDPSKSIVVLPFADLSPEGDQEYFADGLTEELLNSLAQSKNLRVIARTSSFSFKGRNVDIATVARQLGVTHVLEGSVRKWGDRVRITAQLVDAAHSSHLWSQTYDRELREVLTVQSDIAHSVAAALEVALGAGHSGGAPDPQAYEHYLRAHFFVHRRAPGDLERARSYYERAIETDPTYARAWAGLAGAYWLQIHEGDIDGEAGLQKVRAAAERALALDPHQVEAHLRMTNFYWSTGDLQMKMQHQRQAEALAPDHPLLLAFEASQTADKGQWVEAIALQRRVVAADPLSVMSQGNLAVMLLFAGQIEQAKVEVARLRDLDRHAMIATEAYLLILEHRFEDAERVVQTWPNGVERQQCRALIHFGLGRKAEADAALAELISTYGAAHPFAVAAVYGYRGERELAQRWMAATDRLPPYRRPGLVRDSPFLRNVGLGGGER